ncbi:MAG: hypothetical protein ACYSYV_06940 [Planctomycetota bacterium]|jgi:hypothetical protein
MEQNRIYRFAAITVICVLLLMAGCAEPAKETAKVKVEPQETVKTEVEPKEIVKTEVEPKEIVKTKVERKETVETKVEPRETVKTQVEPEGEKPPVKLALKFAPEDSTTYKLIIEADKSVKWDGPTPEKPTGFTGGHTGNRMEMTFAQQIQSVDDKGSATAKITIEGLKYLAKVKDNVVLDFDSSREKDLSNPLSKLIGQSYTIEITGSGQVLKATNVGDARAAVKGGSSAHRTAVRLLSVDSIKERHTIPALPAAGKDQLRTGDNWSSVKSFSFDLMGSKAYEKVYTLKEVKDIDNRQIAIARMDAIPSAEKAKELHKEQGAAFVSKMFDNTETYAGELKLDLTGGKVEECHEKLVSEWVIVDPNPKDEQQPAALRMTASRLYSIERVD